MSSLALNKSSRITLSLLRKILIVLLGIGILLLLQEKIIGGPLESLQDAIKNTSEGTKSGIEEYQSVGFVNILELLYGCTMFAGWLGSVFPSMFQREWVGLWVGTFFWIIFYCTGSWILVLMLPLEVRNVSIWCKIPFPVPMPGCGNTTQSSSVPPSQPQIFSSVPMIAPKIYEYN